MVTATAIEFQVQPFTMPEEINFNDEQLKKEIGNLLESKYTNIVYSDETIGEAKTDKAFLNKLSDSIENERKRIKKACLAPYEAFEKKEKSIIALIEDTKSGIDSQIKTYEDKRKAAKREEITNFYLENALDLEKLVPLDRIFEEKWLNTTTKEKYKPEMLEIFSRIRTDIDAIKTLESKFETEIMNCYLDTLSLTDAMSKNQTLIARAKAFAEREVQQKALAQDAQNVQSTSKENLQVEPKKETLKTYKFETTSTYQQACDLAKYMDAQGISYKAI